MIRRRFVGHVVAPLALGALVYLALRPNDIRLFAWVQAVGLGGVVEALRSVTLSDRPFVPSTLIGSAPDAAWAYAFGAALGLVWGRTNTHGSWAWWWPGLASVAALELGQHLG